MSDSEALQATDNQVPAEATFRSAPIEQLSEQVQDIQNVMDELMQEGTHYDDVTGDGRNSLLQPGAEKLCFAFQFAPSFDVERIDVAPEDVPNADEPIQGHREYIVNCKLHHRPTGQYVGSGHGSCATYESKYRYRKIDRQTSVPVPSGFWDSYEDSMANADFSILEKELASMGVDMPDNADAGVTKNDDGEWRITVQAKGENPDIADQYNTVLKMAEKRALVNAVKRATAASDIFTQDTEDLAVRSGSNVQRKDPGKGTRRPRQSTGASKSGKNHGTKPGASWTAPAGDEWEGLHPKAVGKLNEWDKKLSDVGGADLGARIEALRQRVSWDGTEGQALSRLLQDHEQRLNDSGEAVGDSPSGSGATSPENEGAPQTKSSPQTSDDADLETCMDRNFDEAWQSDERNWDSISEAQLNRMYAIAEDHGWDEAALNRLVKDELGYSSKSGVPYGDPYDEICAALEDERLRYHMHRDPDTPDLWDEGESEEDPFEDSVEDNDDLPF